MDFFDVPAFDDSTSRQLFLRAADAGALADARKTNTTPQRGKRSAKGEAEAEAKASNRAKKQRTATTPGAQNGKAATPGKEAAKAGSTPAGADGRDGMPSGRNLGRRRRLREKRARERQAREGGSQGQAKLKKRDKSERIRVAVRSDVPSGGKPSATPSRKEARLALLKEKRRLQRASGGVNGDEASRKLATRGDPTKEIPGSGGAVRGNGGKKMTKAPSMVEEAQARLTGAHFRWLNEQLYTRSGSDSLTLMQSSPELFDMYHEGFRRQTKQWPQNPLDLCITWLHRCPTWWAVADIGCGDARLSGSVPQKVRSFDLVATQPNVEACDMAHLPLADGEMHAAVFCLSLMGTDYGAALEEASRVLAPAGVLWVAEVRSRFEGETGGVDAFVAAVTALGFQLRHRDESDTMFAVFRWVKSDNDGDGKVKQKKGRAVKWPMLKACEYKRR